MSTEYSSELSLDELKVKIRESTSNENIGKTHQVVLKNGPRAYKIATIFEILDTKDGSVHHYSLKVETYSKSKDAWRKKPDKSISLSTNNTNEIGILTDFLNTYRHGLNTYSEGDYTVISEEGLRKISEVQSLIKGADADKKLDILAKLLGELSSSEVSFRQFEKLFRIGAEDLVRKVSDVSKLVDYRKRLRSFKQLIDEPEKQEKDYQTFLENNAWLFGSEYSQLLGRRAWTRDESLDFMVRRTVDGYLELIEIKTPSSGKLFNFDKSHKSYYPSSSLTKVIGQVMNYINEINDKRDSIRAKDEEDPLKIRGKIIIGRDEDSGTQEALRVFNSHLSDIEILTFDQLYKIGQRTIDIFGTEYK